MGVRAKQQAAWRAPPSVSGFRSEIGMFPLAALTSADIERIKSKRLRTEMVPVLSVSAATMRP